MSVGKEFLILFGITSTLYLVFGKEEPYVPDIDEASLSPCKKNDHFTDPRFTCCAMEKFEAPKVYTDENAIKQCMEVRKQGADKIVKSAWETYNCVVEKVIGRNLDHNKFYEVMSEKFTSGIKSTIKKHLDAIKETHDPYKDMPELAGFEMLAKIWSAYYTAEQMACIEHGTKKQGDDPGNRCFSWMQQSARRGDCCMDVPMPYQLQPDPITLQYYALKNYTATHLMTMLGEDYNWMNTTIVMYSDNIAACTRTSRFALQGIMPLDTLKNKVEKQIVPDYNETADMIIPKYIKTDVRDQMKDLMFEEDLHTDYTLVLFKNKDFSMYKYVYAEEWLSAKVNVNSTRYLFWYCYTHLLLNRRYKQIDVTKLCY